MARSMKNSVIAYVKKKNVEASLVFVMFVFGFFFNLWIFSRSWLITGVDGPYYLIQVRGILRSGSLVYGDPPLTFYLLAFFSLLTGDTMSGVKIGVSFFCALSTIPIFFLMKRVGKGRLSGFIAMLLVVFSAPQIRMMTDFMKNAIGICWLLFFVYYLHDLAFSENSLRKSLVLATFFLVLTGITHVLDFGVALLFLILYAAIAVFLNINRRSLLTSVGIVVLAMGVFVFLAATYFGSLFTDFNKILSFLHGLASSQGRETRPFPLAPRPERLGTPPRPEPFAPTIPFSLEIVGGWGVILLVFSFGAFLSLYLWRKREKEPFLLLTVTTAVGSMTCFPLIPSEWLGRFLLMFVVPAAIILSYGLSKINQLLGRASRVNASLFLIAFCLTFSIVQAVSIAVQIRPTIGYAEYLDLVNMKSRIPPNSVVVVPIHGMYYWVQYVDEVDVVGPGVSADLWPSYSHVLALFPKGNLPPLPSNGTLFMGSIFILVELQPP